MCGAGDPLWHQLFHQSEATAGVGRAREHYPEDVKRLVGGRSIITAFAAFNDWRTDKQRPVSPKGSERELV